MCFMYVWIALCKLILFESQKQNTIPMYICIHFDDSITRLTRKAHSEVKIMSSISRLFQVIVTTRYRWSSVSRKREVFTTAHETTNESGCLSTK